MDSSPQAGEGYAPAGQVCCQSCCPIPNLCRELLKPPMAYAQLTLEEADVADETSRSDNPEAAGSPKGSKGKSDKKGRSSDRPAGPIGKIILFFREVIEQLRKVVYPTKKQLITYSIVVLIFVLIIMAYIGVLDVIFVDLMQRAFGVS